MSTVYGANGNVEEKGSGKKLWLQLGLASLPALLGIGLGIFGWWIGTDRYLQFTFKLPSLSIQVGIFISLIVWAIIGFRVAVSRAHQQGYAEGTEAGRLGQRQFLARLDHELKNPLTAIRAAVATAQASPNVASPETAIIDSQSQRMSNLLTNLRRLSDLETTPLHFEDVNIEETARDAIEAVQTSLKSAGEHREFIVSFPAVPWPLPHIQGDADLLFSACLNLVSNAAKYSAENARIEVRGSQVGRFIHLEVADNGIGIPSTDAHVVWTELGRASNARGHQGSGLGLALVSTIARRHGGWVRLSSVENVGTSIVLALPLPENAPEM